MPDPTPGRSSPRGRAGELASRQPTIDLLVSAAGTAIALWVMVASTEVGARPPDALGVTLLASAGAVLLGRRRWPAAVLASVTVIVAAYLVLDYPGGAELPLVMAGVYTAVAEGRRLAGLTACGLIVVANVTYRLLVDGDDPVLVAGTVTLLLLVVALGEATRARRQLRGEVHERLRLVQLENELEAQATLTAERLRIARELHDVLAHTITAITVQAGAVADGLDETSPARPVLRAMRASARDAMRQLQATIAVLRAGPDQTPRLAAPGLGDIPRLAESARTAGLQVDLAVADLPETLPAALELTAYRIVQESLTNVIRHANASRVEVTVTHRPDAVTVGVADDGQADDENAHHLSVPANGFGLTGMRERVEAIGGTMAAGPQPDGGFGVRAVLPIGVALQSGDAPRE